MLVEVHTLQIKKLKTNDTEAWKVQFLLAKREKKNNQNVPKAWHSTDIESYIGDRVSQWGSSDQVAIGKLCKLPK